MRGHRIDDRPGLAELPEDVDAQLEMGAPEVAVDGLADVVHERGTRRDVRIETDLASQDTREVGHLFRMTQHVLAVRRSEPQAPHQPEELGVHVEEAQLEGGRLALLQHGFFHLGLDLVDDLLDASRVDPPVGDETLDGLARDLAPEGIEAREDDRARRVVDNQFDTRGLLERADVTALPADDAALHVLARQVDHRHRRFNRVLGRAPLNRLDDVPGGPCPRRPPELRSRGASRGWPFPGGRPPRSGAGGGRGPHPR